MQPRPLLSELTTLRVGGPAQTLLVPESAEALIDAVLQAWATDDEWLILGGGSNVVISDDGFPGTVIRVATRGIERVDVESIGLEREGIEREGVESTGIAHGGGSGGSSGSHRGVILRVQAGEPWDELVRITVELGLAGIEALSGIPGSTGAAPIQNIGAYGQELGTTLESIAFLDYLDGEVVRLTAADLELGYRHSALKAGRAGVVLSVDLRLSANQNGLSDPIDFPQLATALGVELGDRLPVAEVREAVLALRRSKGMVLDETDSDSVSAGSFFTNPIVSREFARSLPSDTPRWNIETVTADDPADVVVPLESFDPSGLPVPAATGSPRVKLSAAWLIEHSGVGRGFSLPGSRAAISRKHSLAIVNTGGATAEQVAELARYVQIRVLTAYGVVLTPEPVLIGVRL